jgi:uncharacterized protein (TIGR00369 family)
MKEKLDNPYPDDNCFFCGSENDSGLKLKFHFDKATKEISTEYLPAQHFAGQGNILHGGIQMGILDEIMGWTTYVHTGEMAVTSNINVNFLSPAYIGNKKLKATCRLSSIEGKKVEMIATLSDGDGKVCTEATGTFHIISADRFEKLIHGNSA